MTSRALGGGRLGASNRSGQLDWDAFLGLISILADEVSDDGDQETYVGRVNDLVRRLDRTFTKSSQRRVWLARTDQDCVVVAKSYSHQLLVTAQDVTISACAFR